MYPLRLLVIDAQYSRQIFQLDVLFGAIAANPSRDFDAADVDELHTVVTCRLVAPMLVIVDHVSCALHELFNVRFIHEEIIHCVTRKSEGIIGSAPVEYEHAMRHMMGLNVAMLTGNRCEALKHVRDARADLYQFPKWLMIEGDKAAS